VANSAAVALENLRLRQDLSGTQVQLNQAYDTAVDAWRRALELRDAATETHGTRVAELTVRLASSLGYNPSDLIHIRFGAQLHDIGKIGVPDRVLLKPGPFDDDDRQIMCQHPIFAYEMLSPIPSFSTILDIPYYHHERWDGSGYPLGITGEAIPLPARIFSIVDVWDALASDRPYRQAWEKEEIYAYLLEQSGKQFDPKVVSTFLLLMQTGDTGGFNASNLPTTFEMEK
jgi:HD-GYP domain-containing protein (c-di-GMP phosphodiesterase class II)